MVADQVWDTHGQDSEQLALATPHEFNRRLKYRQVPLVVRRIVMVDLNPFPGARSASWLKRNDVPHREMQIRSLGGGESYSDTAVTYAGEHLLANEISIKTCHLSGCNTRDLEQK